MATQQQTERRRARALEAPIFAALLRRSSSRGPTRAKEAVETAVRTLAEQALRERPR